MAGRPPAGADPSLLAAFIARVSRGHQARCCRQGQEDPRPAAREGLHLVHHLRGPAVVQPLPGVTRPRCRLTGQVCRRAALGGAIGHRAELITERKQSIRQPLLSLGRLLLQLALCLAQQVPALTAGLRRNARSLFPGNVGHVLSCLNAAVTQVSRLILNNVSRALLLRRLGREGSPRCDGVDAGG